MSLDASRPADLAIAMDKGGRPPFTLTRKIVFGSGAAASAIKQRGLVTFLLIFYNQVVGLSPALVSTAIMITLIFDALVDPLVGQISDNYRSRWGRRHPFMYAAAIPVSLAYFLIWNPPGWSEPAVFAYMLVCLLTIRLFDTFFELPSSALVPELAPGYTERTKLLGIRQAFSVIGGLGMTILALQVFMREGADGSGGMTDRDGYLGYSVTAGLVILVAILGSALATHPQIPYLRQPPERTPGLTAMAREVKATLNNRGFVVLAVAGMFTAVGAGLKYSLEMYFRIYFWGLSQTQITGLVTIGVIAALGGVALAAPLSHRLGKKRAAILVFLVAIIAWVIPIFMRLGGVAPLNGTPELLGMLAAEAVVNGAAATATGVLIASMFADVVEDVEVKTGRRAEGLLLSANNLLNKLVSGIGVFLAGAILAWVEFPKAAVRGAVDGGVLQNLGLAAIPAAMSVGFIGVLALVFVRSTRASHEANLQTLAERKRSSDAAGG